MARVKRGVAAHARHKKMLEAAKGHRATSHTHYGRAKESLLHAWSYAYAHRRSRKRESWRREEFGRPDGVHPGAAYERDAAATDGNRTRAFTGERSTDPEGRSA